MTLSVLIFNSSLFVSSENSNMLRLWAIFPGTDKKNSYYCCINGELILPAVVTDVFSSKRNFRNFTIKKA